MNRTRTDEREPTAADLAAIEAEWPVTAAELALLDAEIRILCAHGPCSASPWGTCVRCRPGGKNRTCRACNGTGMRPRLGWQFYAHLRRIHRDGTR